MSNSFKYRPRFVDIRVRPPGKEEPVETTEDVLRLKPGEKPCEWPDCRAAATAKAPKSRDMLNEHYMFCQAHASEYNRNWNFFAGMSEAQIRAAHEARLTGERPTWQFKASRFSREAASLTAKGGATQATADPFGIFGGDAGRTEAKPARRLGSLERKALAELDLDEAADANAIRVRYLELVKRCHPDSNGGDRSTEAKLQKVLKAYKTLKGSGMVS